MKAICGVVAALLLALATGEAAAQTNYPDQPIRILVGFTPGVAPDITSRLLAEKFTAAWGKSVVVENVTGAGGNIATERVATRGTRRLHLADGRQCLAHLQPEPVRQARLRSDQGLRADHADLRGRQRPGGASRRAGEDAAGTHCAGAGATGQAHLCACRRRHLAASRRGASSLDDRHRYPAGGLSRHHPPVARPAGRARDHVVRQHRERAAADP